MARYSIRDLIGHFVSPRSAGGKMPELDDGREAAI